VTDGISRKTVPRDAGHRLPVKWSVDGIEGYTKTGKAPSHAAGVKLAERAIDKAQAPKKKRLQRPE
jgi:hypothetical protein